LAPVAHLVRDLGDLPAGEHQTLAGGPTASRPKHAGAARRDRQRLGLPGHLGVPSLLDGDSPVAPGDSGSDLRPVAELEQRVAAVDGPPAHVGDHPVPVPAPVDALAAHALELAPDRGGRRIHLRPSTVHPDSAWVTQQARNLALNLDARTTPVRFLIRDRDAKFSRPFDMVLRSEGMRIIRTPVRAPNANAYAERVIETMRAECLDWTLIWGRAAS
jgi:hypothetical protein